MHSAAAGESVENKKDISAWNSGNNHLNMKPGIF